MELDFKAYIVEGVLDYDTTLISRAIFNNIKRHEQRILALSDGTNFQLTYAKSKADNWNLERATKASGLYIADYAHLEMPENVNSPTLNVLVGLGEPRHNGSYERTQKILTIRIGIPVVNGRLDYNATLPMVKAVLRHELEHSAQKDSAPYVRVGDYKWQAVDNKAPTGTEWGDAKSVIAYFTHPSEIEAWTAGIYKYAKTARIDFKDAMTKQLQRLALNMKNNNMDQPTIDSVVNRIKSDWLAYQKHRFPAARV